MESLEPLIEADRLSVRYPLQRQRAHVTLRETLVQALDPRRLVRGFARSPVASPDPKRTPNPISNPTSNHTSTRPPTRADGHLALRDVSLTLRRGEVVGVIGRNGAGKTTLLQTLAGIFLPDEGRLVRRGRVSCLLSLGAGFHGNLTGRENVFLNGAVLGVPTKRIAAQLDAVVAFSDLADFIDAPVRTYSAGMRARLGFSVALLVDPDVVILDEILRVGDAAFREKAGSILDRFRVESRAVLLASHSMDIVRRHCDRVLWLDRGSIRAEGTPAELTAAYLEDARREQDRLGAVIPDARGPGPVGYR